MPNGNAAEDRPPAESLRSGLAAPCLPATEAPQRPPGVSKAFPLALYPRALSDYCAACRRRGGLPAAAAGNRHHQARSRDGRAGRPGTRSPGVCGVSAAASS
jgi:hypothetical protein